MIVSNRVVRNCFGSLTGAHDLTGYARAVSSSTAPNQGLTRYRSRLDSDRTVSSAGEGVGLDPQSTVRKEPRWRPRALTIR